MGEDGRHEAATIEVSVCGVSIPPGRAEACVKSLTDWKADADSMSSV